MGSSVIYILWMRKGTEVEGGKGICLWFTPWEVAERSGAKAYMGRTKERPALGVGHSFTCLFLY